MTENTKQVNAHAHDPQPEPARAQSTLQPVDASALADAIVLDLWEQGDLSDNKSNKTILSRRVREIILRHVEPSPVVQSAEQPEILRQWVSPDGRESVTVTRQSAEQPKEQLVCNHRERNPHYDGHYCNVCKRDIVHLRPNGHALYTGKCGIFDPSAVLTLNREIVNCDECLRDEQPKADAPEPSHECEAADAMRRARDILDVATDDDVLTFLRTVTGEDSAPAAPSPAPSLTAERALELAADVDNRVARVDGRRYGSFSLTALVELPRAVAEGVIAACRAFAALQRENEELRQKNFETQESFDSATRVCNEQGLEIADLRATIDQHEASISILKSDRDEKAATIERQANELIEATCTLRQIADLHSIGSIGGALVDAVRFHVNERAEMSAQLTLLQSRVTDAERGSAEAKRLAEEIRELTGQRDTARYELHQFQKTDPQRNEERIQTRHVYQRNIALGHEIAKLGRRIHNQREVLHGTRENFKTYAAEIRELLGVENDEYAAITRLTSELEAARQEMGRIIEDRNQAIATINGQLTAAESRVTDKTKRVFALEHDKGMLIAAIGRVVALCETWLRHPHSYKDGVVVAAGTILHPLRRALAEVKP